MAKRLTKMFFHIWVRQEDYAGMKSFANQRSTVGNSRSTMLLKGPLTSRTASTTEFPLDTHLNVFFALKWVMEGG